MKKKLLLAALSSVFALGILGACGDVENEEIDNGDVNDNGLDDDFGNDTGNM